MTSVDGRRVLFVHAHPDDESITTGGTIARYSAEGAHVTVVTCTLGEEGEIIPAELEQLGAWAGDQLGGYRIGELAEAGVALGWSEHRFLGGPGRWRDSGMAGVESNEHPRAFVRRSGEHTSELQSRENLVCRLLLEKKKTCQIEVGEEPKTRQKVDSKSSRIARIRQHGDQADEEKASWAIEMET